MMETTSKMEIVADEEDVARILFSPLFICEGVLSQKAFTLEQAKDESYISVLRPAIDSFNADMTGIKKEDNVVFGYALLNVGEVRHAKFDYSVPLRLDVLPRNAGKRKSHAGIFATIGCVKVKGGSPQSVARLMMRMRLVNIAQKRIVEFSR
jgi:hypothetical protein